jgi:DNA-binding XRE family transcriptional regulator
MDKDFIKHIRHVLQLSQAGLAEVIDVDRSLISKVENGKSNLSAKLEQKIKEAFHAEGFTEADLKQFLELVKKVKRG